MAYQVRQREPLFDRNTQAMLERRGKELLGAGLLVLAVLAALILGSYSQDDPSWLSASSEPAENLLGRFGASLAQPAYVIAGWGAWMVPLVLAVWGVRFLAHRGDERAASRAVLAPIAVALASVYAATHLPSPGWTHSFGMGGLFGDTVLGAVLNLLPLRSGLGLKLVSLLLGVGVVGLTGYVCGFTRAEVSAIGRFLLVGVVLTYAGALRLARAGLARAFALLRRAALATLHGGQAMAAAVAERREARADARAQAASAAPDAVAFDSPRGEAQVGIRRAAPVIRPHSSEPPLQFAAGEAEYQGGLPVGGADDGAVLLDEEPSAIAAYQPVAQAGPRNSLLSRVPSFLKRLPSHSAAAAGAAPAGTAAVAEPPLTAAERLRQRIANAISAREGAEAVQRPEPPVQRPRGPQPIVFDPAKYPVARASAAPVDTGPDEPPLPPEPESDWVAAADAGLVDLEAEDESEGYVPSYGIPVPESRKVVQHPLRRQVLPSRQARAEAQPGLGFEERHPAYEAPPLALLASPESVERHHLSDEALEENARMLESVLDDYGVRGEIVSVRPGPVVTMYELEPAPGLKASRVIGLADDIARSMSALSARVSTVPGRSVIGIELPNAQREKVVLREILAARDFGDTQMRLPLALGKDIGGEPVVANLAKMPHLLIAGTTGSGKSVAINTMILSLLYKLTPAECRLIMIDPKMLELSVYDGIPHLLSPVVTDPKKAVVALKWVVGEMEDRYRKMSKMGVRNIEGYNGRVREALGKGETFKRTIQTGFDDETGDPVFETEELTPEAFPYIVVIVDEMADLMMVAGKEIEACIQRLAQMARASGIHLIMATQRPSVDVITGTIKANFPTRISFQVTSKIDSRTILGEMGAEQLLGMGDMLYMAGGGRISRVHGPFVSDEEVEEVVTHLKGFGPPDYVGGVVEGPEDSAGAETSVDELLGLGSDKEGDEALYDMAVAIVAKDRKCSTSYIQRKLAIGYNKAARLVEQMETEGVVSSANPVGKREILVPEPA